MMYAMQEIRLTKGYVALVDDQDFEWLTQWKWCAHENTRYRRTKVYAYRQSGGRMNRKNVFMHRLLLDAPFGVQVDHIDADGLNNQRTNLRLATAAQNATGRRGYSASGYKGVSWNKTSWGISVSGFATAEEAAHAYDDIAKRAHGEFAQLNFPGH